MRPDKNTVRYGFVEGFIWAAVGSCVVYGWWSAGLCFLAFGVSRWDL